MDQVQCGTLKETGQLAKSLNLLQPYHLLLHAHRLLDIPPLPCRLSSGQTRAKVLGMTFKQCGISKA
jgi:hypothetical protein